VFHIISSIFIKRKGEFSMAKERKERVVSSICGNIIGLTACKKAQKNDALSCRNCRHRKIISNLEGGRRDFSDFESLEAKRRPEIRA
jgi:DNA-directed RNA polymerase subunit RPC12/RpoP